jgi:hypothetical protein
MIRANMEDLKTQTRRTKGLDKFPNFEWANIHRVNGVNIKAAIATNTQDIHLLRSPYGQPGDLLWVREAFLKLIPDHFITSSYAYKADSSPESEELRKDYIKAGLKYQWKPSIHMPKIASRIWLMVEEIRVEQLHDISKEDAIAEGIESAFIDLFDEKRYRCYESKNKFPYKGFPKHWASNWREAKSSFFSLWRAINGKSSFEANPWVWVVKYRILSKTGRPNPVTILENYLEITRKEAAHV